MTATARRYDGRFDYAVDYDAMGQLDLGIVPLNEPDTAKGATIQQQFEGFHAANPWVLEAFATLTRDWLARGNKRVGMKMLFETLRWQYGRATKGSEFRLNNNLTSRYARLLVDTYPEFADAFETRALRAN